MTPQDSDNRDPLNITVGIDDILRILSANAKSTEDKAKVRNYLSRLIEKQFPE